jgi:hypothetical protein
MREGNNGIDFIARITRKPFAETKTKKRGMSRKAHRYAHP